MISTKIYGRTRRPASQPQQWMRVWPAGGDGVKARAVVLGATLEDKRAATTALPVLMTERSGPSPSPSERTAPDPKREEYPRDRDELSSERVDQWT
jgi:hypothetical protein